MNDRLTSAFNQLLLDIPDTSDIVTDAFGKWGIAIAIAVLLLLAVIIVVIIRKKRG